MSNTLILASQSPRRKELLQQLGYVFTCSPANIDESVRLAEKPAQYVARLSLEKAQAIQNCLAVKFHWGGSATNETTQFRFQTK